MFKQKPQRPYLKLCTKCHGKGQLSYFNTAQEKKYDSCRKCTDGDSFKGGLGVTLKCFCQDKSATYKFLRASELPYFKGLERDVAKALNSYQKELGSEGTAILLLCDCRARYLVCDKATARLRIRGDSQLNESDKTHNKQIAAELATRGIVRVVCPSPMATSG